ncbi:hypothetical protein PORCRE_1631 [Porphyromonas crevioricanis JCM 15906]|uniref:Uncharacterized protein n=1 Tax=Porphyromonas crevioricanis JCM 15906 TaxID=1305617 RepID=T1CIH3_9PORP|nr:hypothetical protein PORCRE_1631 [Porphyromonas crevioricanis JCM 15906]
MKVLPSFFDFISSKSGAFFLSSSVEIPNKRLACVDCYVSLRLRLPVLALNLSKVILRIEDFKRRTEGRT